MVRDHLGRQFALVEGVAHAPKSGFAPALGLGPFRVDQGVERASQVGLDEPVAGFGRLAARHGDGDARGVQDVLALGDVARHQRIHGKAVAREPRRRMGHLGKRHGSEARERGDQRAQRAGDDGFFEAGGNPPAVPFLEIGARRGLRPEADAA